VLHEAFDGIFNARFFKIKNVEQNKKNIKNVARIKKRFLHLWRIRYFTVMILE